MPRPLPLLVLALAALIALLAIRASAVRLESREKECTDPRCRNEVWLKQLVDVNSDGDGKSSAPPRKSQKQLAEEATKVKNTPAYKFYLPRDMRGQEQQLKRLYQLKLDLHELEEEHEKNMNRVKHESRADREHIVKRVKELKRRHLRLKRTVREHTEQARKTNEELKKVGKYREQASKIKKLKVMAAYGKDKIPTAPPKKLAKEGSGSSSASTTTTTKKKKKKSTKDLKKMGEESEKKRASMSAAEKKADDEKTAKATKKIWSPVWQPKRNKVLKQSADVPAGEKFTYMFWLKIKSKPKKWGALLQKGKAKRVRNPAVWIIPGSTKLHIRSGTTYGWNTGMDTEAVASGKWVHIAFSHEPGMLKAYYDGRLVRKRTMPTAKTNNDPLYSCGPNYDPANVDMADLRVVDRVASPEFIKKVMEEKGYQAKKG